MRPGARRLAPDPRCVALAGWSSGPIPFRAKPSPTDAQFLPVDQHLVEGFLMYAPDSTSDGRISRSGSMLTPFQTL